MQKIKNFYKTICKMPMFWVFAFLMLIYIPKAINTPAENDLVIICTAVGIDKVDEGVELTLLTLLPQNSQTFADVYRLASATGENIGLASHKLVNYLGKKIDMAHAGYVLFGKEMCDSGIKIQLEDLIRSNNIGANATVLATNTTAKKFFETAQQFDSNSGEKVQDIIANNTRNIMDVNKSIDKFYKGFLSTSKCSAINLIKLVDKEQEGVEALSQGGGSGESESGQNKTSSQSKQKKISNDGSTLVVKNAKTACVLNGMQTQGINVVDPKIYEGNFIIKNYITDDGNPVDITFEVISKKIKTTAEIKDGKARIDYYITFSLDVLSVDARSKDSVTKLPEKSFMNEQMQQRISDKFKVNFYSALEPLVEQDLDIIGVNEILKTCGEKKYKEFVLLQGENLNILRNTKIVLHFFADIK